MTARSPRNKPKVNDEAEFKTPCDVRKKKTIINVFKQQHCVCLQPVDNISSFTLVSYFTCAKVSAKTRGACHRHFVMSQRVLMPSL